MQETWVLSLGQEDPLEEEMVTHFNILAWRIPWTEQPGRLQSVESQESDMTWRLNHYQLPSRSTSVTEQRHLHPAGSHSLPWRPDVGLSPGDHRDSSSRALPHPRGCSSPLCVLFLHSLQFSWLFMSPILHYLHSLIQWKMVTFLNYFFI